jgi:hypothetical protein
MSSINTITLDQLNRIAAKLGKKVVDRNAVDDFIDVFTISNLVLLGLVVVCISIVALIKNRIKK